MYSGVSSQIVKARSQPAEEAGTCIAFSSLADKGSAWTAASCMSLTSCGTTVGTGTCKKKKKRRATKRHVKVDENEFINVAPQTAASSVTYRYGHNHGNGRVLGIQVHRHWDEDRYWDWHHHDFHFLLSSCRDT